ncbi:MAG: DUF3127 domain-containing protein [Paludibacteraceae bacterium]|nr:DUF3127 domain-containing protein [Paludibacteraceae bacterium]
MEIAGKIIQKLPLQQGVSKTSGNPWAVQAYVLETQEQYPRKVHFEIFGEQRIKDNPCEIDDIVTISFDIESREFNGRWYTSIRAWKVQQGIVDTAAQQPTAAPVAQSAPAAPAAQPMDGMTAPNIDTFDPAAGESTDDLPF